MDDKQLSRREFLKSLSFAALGSSILFFLISDESFGYYPREERADSIPLEPSGKLLSDMHKMSSGIKNEYPGVAVDADSRVWTVFSSEKNNRESILLREFLHNGKFAEPVKISSSSGFEYQPVIASADSSIHIAWSARRDGQSMILYRSASKGSPGEEIVISDSAKINWNPSIVTAKNGSVWIAWESKDKDRFSIKARRVRNGKLSDVYFISGENEDNRRPDLCCDPEGTVWCAWDRYEGKGNLNVYLKPLNRTDSGEIRVTHHPASSLAPSIDADREGRIWIAWHSNRKGYNGWDIPRWFYLRAYKDGEFFEPLLPPKDKNLRKDGQNQGFEFPRVLCSDDGRIIVTGRPSHNFCIQWYRKNQWSSLYRIPKDGWGGRGQNLRVAQDEKGDLWLTRRDLAYNILQKMDIGSGKYESPELKKYTPPSVIPSITGIEEKHSFPEWNGYQFYFGDIHAHSWMSDGMGDLDEFYLQHRDFLRDDFCVLTDHDTFVGNGMIPSEWREQKDIASHYNDPHHFITMYGQEWTTARWPGAYGHKNIYHIDPDIPLMDHTDENADSTEKIFHRAKKLGAICIPHHTGWTGVDWENHDPEAQPLVEIVSGHGAFEYMGNKPIYHRGGKHGCFVRDGLKRGLKFGLVGASDTHGLIWHHRVGWKRDCLRTGLTCILAKELTREALFDAMKKRRTYATSGIKLRMLFQVEDLIMGEEGKIESPPTIKVNVMSPSDMKWIQIVRDCETIYTYGGEGYISRFTYSDENLKPGNHYYYLRVITEDGNMAWSSPVWVDYKA